MIDRSWLDRSRGSLGILIVLALVLGLVGLAGATLPPGGTFIDDDGNIHEGNIEAIAAEGITRGCNPPTNDRYCPSSRVTRGEMAAFLVRALGLTERLDDPFTDDDDSVFEADIEKLAAAGVTRGCNPPDNDQFCPNQHVTRGQMAAFLVRAMGYTDDGGGDLFIDDDDSVFEGDIDRLGTAGVTKGCNPPTNDRFCPRDYVLRDQMASFLARALGLAPITPPPPTTTVPGETTTTQPSTTTTTLPEVGSEYSSVGPCESSEVRDEFYLGEACLTVRIRNSYWFQSDKKYGWVDPAGEPTGACPVTGECMVIKYVYGGASLIGLDFYFYVAGEDRDPGWHSFELATTGGELLVRENFLLMEGSSGTTTTTKPSTTTTTKPTTTTTSSTTTTTIPDDFDLESVSWSCSEDMDGIWSCVGNIDKRDVANETWACAPYGPTETPAWACQGNVDKGDGAAETWDCDSDFGYCSGDVNKDDDLLEEWGYGQGGQFADGWYGIGYIDPDGDSDSWDCHVVNGDELECLWDYNYYDQAWGCDFTTGGDWTCAGEAGRFAPIVGPVPMFDWIFGLG